jgi:phosphatidate cytidylyltransferase
VRLPEGLALRVLTAGCLLAAFLAALLLLERRVFAVLVAVVVALAGLEWGRLAGFGRGTSVALGLGSAALFGVLAATIDPAGPLGAALFAAGALFWLLLAPAWLRLGLARSGRLLLAAAGVATLTVTGLAAVTLPPAVLLLVLGLVWIADVAAYFAGNAFGRHKLAPVISPGKTWEGIAGAAAATIVYAIICALSGAPLGRQVQGRAWIAYLGAVALLCGMSVVGDLFESALKRRAGAKDSGALLPGHGGVLDRIDSVMPTLPIAAMFLAWIPSP